MQNASIASYTQSSLVSGASARALATYIVHDCVSSGHSLSMLLPSYLESLKTAQRPFAQEVCFGSLRWYFRLDSLLECMLTKPLRGKKKIVHSILLVGLYQLNYLDKVDYAIVKETVNVCDELKQSWAKGLVNAILRRFLREKEGLLAELDKSYESRFAYPQWLVSAIKRAWQGEAIEALLSAGNQRPPMVLRINQQFSLADYKQQLIDKGYAFSSFAISNSAYHKQTVILDKPVAVEQLPLFSAGAVSVQDAAPQLAAHLLSPQAGETILDACAAPGGKTMHLFEVQPHLDQVIALDVSEQRLERVVENSQRLNIPSEKLSILSGDASAQQWWNGELFDRILLDAPCSATGVIRRHPDIKLLRRSHDIEELVILQANILDNLWLMLKPGGVLLYATCSILRDENDKQIEAFIARQMKSKTQVEELLIDENWGQAMPYGRQILPGKENMDGFYYALLKKPSNG